MVEFTILAGSTLVVTASFADEDGTPVTPQTLTWTLTAGEEIVNGRDNVVLVPAQTVTVVLSGADNPALETTRRKITFRATYNSLLGSDLSLVEQASYFVKPV